MNSCALSDNPSPQRRSRSLRQEVGEEAAVTGAPSQHLSASIYAAAAGQTPPLQIHQSQQLFFVVLMLSSSQSSQFAVIARTCF